MAEQIEILNGKLVWGEETVELSFKIEIKKDASVSIRFEPLVYETPEARREGWRVHQILEDIQLKRSRRVVRFELNGRSADGIEFSTSCARLVNGSTYDLGSPMTLRLVGTADELLFTYPSASEKCEEIDACVEYLTPGQLGGVGCDSLELPQGILTFLATCKVGEAKEFYGALSIEKRVPRADLDQWLDECDELAERAMHLLSLAQGRWYNWAARIVYRQDEEGAKKLFRCVRPRERRDAVRIHLFHHLNLGPSLELLRTSYTRKLIEETGLDTALILMLTASPYTEGRMWNQLVALEHLLTKFEVKAIGVIDKKVFQNELKPLLRKVLEEAIQKGWVSPEKDEYTIFKQKIGQLNSPSLYSKFLQFVDYYKVPLADLDPEDVKFVVVHCRNDLAHQGVPVRIGEDRDRLYLMADLAEELLNRIVMAMLGYEGQYVSAFDHLEHYWFSKAGVKPVNPPNRLEELNEQP